LVEPIGFVEVLEVDGDVVGADVVGAEVVGAVAGVEAGVLAGVEGALLTGAVFAAGVRVLVAVITCADWWRAVVVRLVRVVRLLRAGA
jgi:hypothetical protein